jgi:phosphatidylglycerophosphate synthase
MTLSGVAGALICGLAYVASWRSPAFLWLASLGVIINWFGDSLDGGLARARHRERPRYGFFIDHTTDVLSELFIFFGLGASPYMRFDVACRAVISYWLAALFSFIRAVATGIFQISYWGVGPTEIRLGLIGYNLLLLAVGRLEFATRFGTFSLIDIIVIVIFVAVFTSFLLLVIVEGRRLAKEDVPS